MLRAIIFDFDGVIANSEPVHFAVFRRVLSEQGFHLDEAEYYAEYLGYDDRGCFEAFFRAHGLPFSADLVSRLVKRKAAVYLEHIQHHLVIFPGVRDFVHAAAARLDLAICSGALRHEIEYILEAAGIRKEFRHITSAEDVSQGKPNPEGFVHALDALNTGRADSPLHPADCLVIEDSIPGIRAARAAGMKVLAVSNTHPASQLHEADLVTASLEEVQLSELERQIWTSRA